MAFDDDSPTIACPHCGHTIYARARFCRRCGKTPESAAPPACAKCGAVAEATDALFCATCGASLSKESQSEPEAQIATKTCPSCGSTIPRAAKICGACNSYLPREPAIPAPQPKAASALQEDERNHGSMARPLLYVTLGIGFAFLVAVGTLWHYQSIANTERTALRAQINHSAKLLAQVNSSLAAMETTVGPVTGQLQAIFAVEQQRHDEATSDSPDLDTLQTLVHEEQADYDDFAGSTGTMLASMRALTNAIEATGTGADTRDLRGHLDDIATNLMAGGAACTVASRMVADNLEQLQRYGLFGLMNTSSASDVQRSYDECDQHFTTAMGNLPSFHDSAVRLRDVLSERLHNARARYLRIHGPLDSLFGVPTLPPQEITQDAAGTENESAPAAVAPSEAPPVSEPSPAVGTPQAENSPSGDSPLTGSNVSSLLNATSSIRVSKRTNSAGIPSTYVSVPETPAKGSVNADQLWGGRMADGRWVGIVPLDSGGQAGIVYALMWVWTNSKPQFVGEIPADNNGLGNLTMSVQNGNIILRWPLLGPQDARCCPSLVRQKVLTLDGIRLRPLSDTIVANSGSGR